MQYILRTRLAKKKPAIGCALDDDDDDDHDDHDDHDHDHDDKDGEENAGESASSDYKGDIKVDEFSENEDEDTNKEDHGLMEESSKLND